MARTKKSTKIDPPTARHTSLGAHISARRHALKRALSRGSTLVDMLVVIVVIAILAGLLLAVYPGVMKRVRQAERDSDVHNIQLAIEQYYVDHGHYPYGSNLVAGGSGVNLIDMPNLSQGVLSPPPGNCNFSCTGVLPGKVISEIHRIKLSDVPPNTGYAFTIGYFCGPADPDICPSGGESYVYVPTENGSTEYGCENPPTSCQGYQLQYRNEPAGRYNGKLLRGGR